MALIANESVEARAMLVRLSIAWIDPLGVVHGAGEHVDIDAVTLAELEEQGVVEIMTEPKEKEAWNGPDGTEPEAQTDWNGPDGTEPEAQTDGPDGKETEGDGEGDWNGPDGDGGK